MKCWHITIMKQGSNWYAWFYNSLVLELIKTQFPCIKLTELVFGTRVSLKCRCVCNIITPVLRFLDVWQRKDTTPNNGHNIWMPTHYMCPSTALKVPHLFYWIVSTIGTVCCLCDDSASALSDVTRHQHGCG